MNTNEPYIIYPELSNEILGIAFEVHNQLGPGFTEDLYERAFILELKARQIPFEEQKVVKICYKGEQVGTYRLDLAVDQKVIVELKAVSQLNDLFKRQLKSYLKATGMQLGYLLNFGNSSVEHVRYVNTKPANMLKHLNRPINRRLR